MTYRRNSFVPYWQKTLNYILAQIKVWPRNLATPRNAAYNSWYTNLMITNEQKQTIIEYVKKLPIEVIYLFGSHATNEVKPLSDYDFGILFDEKVSKSERFDLKLDIMGFLSHIFKTDNVDVVDLNSAPPAFRYEAMKPRCDIYSRLESKRVEFEFKAMQEHLDRLYFIKRHTRIGLAIIAREGI